MVTMPMNKLMAMIPSPPLLPRYPLTYPLLYPLLYPLFYIKPWPKQLTARTRSLWPRLPSVGVFVVKLLSNRFRPAPKHATARAAVPTIFMTKRNGNLRADCTEVAVMTHVKVDMQPKRD